MRRIFFQWKREKMDIHYSNGLSHRSDSDHQPSDTIFISWLNNIFFRRPWHGNLLIHPDLTWQNQRIR
jgi:hypothetical protein